MLSLTDIFATIHMLRCILWLSRLLFILVAFDHNCLCNCVGIEAALWSELVRTSSRLDSMLWPRMLAVAERSWHKASWEVLRNMETSREGYTSVNNTAFSQDWARFASNVGHKELRRLNAQGVDYYLPRPGARFL